MGPPFPTGFLPGQEHIWIDFSQLLMLGLNWEGFLVQPLLAESSNPMEWEVLPRAFSPPCVHSN